MILCGDPRANYLDHRAEIDAAVSRVLESGWYVLGNEVAQFEREFAAFIGVQHCIGVANGTDAITLSLRALGIGPGDEVITVAHTAIATIAGIIAVGATPVFADISSTSYTLDPASARRQVTARTKAIMPVHLYGHPADLDELLALATEVGVPLVEDCAQCHGAMHTNRMTGGIGRIAAFSFYPTKNLGAIGDGGCIVTNDSELDAQLRLLRQYGWRVRNKSETIGVNSRLDELQAAILRVKLGHLADDNRRRQQNAAYYLERLVNPLIALPTTAPDRTHVYHQFVLTTEDRDGLLTHLETAGVQAQIHYPLPAHRQPAYAQRSRFVEAELRATDHAAAHVLSIPVHQSLTEEQRDRVVAAVNRFGQGSPEPGRGL